MKISFNWLKQYVGLPDSISPKEVGEKLKLATVEVEEIISQGKNLENIVVGKVLSVEKHPEADKLKICQVDVGDEKLAIVCGGSNVYEKMITAVAKVGAKVKWHGEGELVELKPTAIRGVESKGMICGASEVGFEDLFPPKDSHEILDLTGVVANKFIGKPIALALELNDSIFEIDNKSLSNRPDLWGHYGMAREVATLFSKTLKEYPVEAIKKIKNEVDLKVEIEDAKLCPRYMAVAISGVQVEESPGWLKQRLLSVGLRPINNIVDITNYVMLDLGEPMHAFDAEKLAKNKDQGIKIIVRKAKKEEVLKLLDEEEVKLVENDLVIADSQKALALAGVMGGEDSGINKKTETIIFEAANFNASAIRRISSRLGARTDSSARFEKCLDPNWCELAIKKAVQLTLELCPKAKVSSKIIDEKNFSLATGPLTIEKNIFIKKLGIEIPEKKIVEILERLGFMVTDKGDKLSVKIPTWRATKDVSIAEDLVEEVARVYGYENIPSVLPKMSITPPTVNRLRLVEHAVRDCLTRDLGFCETNNYAFVSKEQIQKMGDTAEYLELDNPLSKEKPFLCRSLVPNLTENIVKNIEFFDTVALYEIAKVFWPEEPGARSGEKDSELLPRQDVFLTTVFAQKKNENPLLEIQRVLERIAGQFNLNYSINELTAGAKAWQHAGRSGEIMADGQIIGSIYELNPFTADKFGLKAVRVAILEINLSIFAGLPIKPKKYKKIPQFPAMIRDLSFMIDKKIAHAKIVEALESISDLLDQIELFDVYEGKNLPENKKSLAYRFVFSHPEKTLNTDEVEEAMKKIEAKLKKEFGVETRK
jgi:phenylalanyl-tRNA synthetase beta chain